MTGAKQYAKINPALYSEYAKSSNVEAFAETHAAYMMGQTELLTPEAIKLMDKIYETLADYNP
jgi:hypothetical protein